jgi:hypothetical protein
VNVPEYDAHELAVAFARLEGRVIAMTDMLERDRQSESQRGQDHEARIRAIELRPRAITWPEFLTTTVSMIAGSGALAAFVSYFVIP